MRSLGLVPAAVLMLAWIGVSPSPIQAKPMNMNTLNTAQTIRDGALVYFPLEVGNQWIYRSTTLEGIVIEVVETREVQGKTYFVVKGLVRGRDVLVRESKKGTLVIFDEESKTENLWYDFKTKKDDDFISPPHVCAPKAIMTSRTYTYRGLIGTYSNALQLTYPGVFQCGNAQEIFVPTIGLVQWTEVRGPAQYVYDLMYVRLGKHTVLTQPEIGFSITLDQSTYLTRPPGSSAGYIPHLTAKITLRSTHPTPLKLTFPTGQLFDFSIRDEKGEVFYTWSDGKGFPEVITEESVSGDRHFVIGVPLITSDARVLPAGRYIAEAWITTQGTRKFVASVGFEVVDNKAKLVN